MPTVADYFLEGVVEQGCEAIFLNPGTDTPPLQEAWARRQRNGLPVPKLVVCPHEIVAVTAAQGYYVASGKPQIAFVHVDVGTANAAGGLNDARASRIPVLLCAGLSPSTLDSRIPGSRTKFVNWQQDVPDQAALVRNYAKWIFNVTHAGAIGPAVDRAFQIAQSEPEGPVYMSFPREVLMQEIDSAMMLGPQRCLPVKLPGLSADVARSVAEELARADFPLIITGYGGRTRASREALVEFAEALAVPITEYRGRFSAPLEHPLHLGFNPEKWVEKADVILVVDHDVPWVPADRPLRPGVRVIHMGPDPIKQEMVIWGFPTDQVLACGLEPGLQSLAQAARELSASLAKEEQQALEARRAKVGGHHEEMFADLEKGASRKGSNAITPFQIGRALTRLCPEANVIEEAVTSGNPFAYGFLPNEEGTYSRNGGTFLGWGLGASIGAKMAAPEKTVVTVLGDGSFMFGVPSASLWVSKHYKLPMLILILNNNAYNSVRLASRDSYPEGVMAETGWVGSELPDLPNFARLAEACGVWGKQVDQPGELDAVLEEALAIVRGGTTAVVEIKIEAANKPL
ncbi:thiamine pyrophosphate-requiring protein [Telmatospirillum sp. J64-1]|uniref:thiamine pyrophosphate-requiring protein n=1 Tax=Telmatospirillum sp. J64-1 TaxID=2502183 RepID=UPI00115D427D|nr:thiamine pyrophosphate-requiring protein [Telmatospirillum sp. J64-1]